MVAMKPLTLDQILQAKDLIEEDVEVPEWGGTVRIRSFTKEQGNRLTEEATVDGKRDLDLQEMLMLVEGIVSPPGITREHIGALKAKSSKSIGRVLHRILVINGMREEDGAKAKKAFPGGAS